MQALPIFIGAIIGFLIVDSLGVIAGDRIAARIPLRVVKVTVGLVFILFGLLVVAGMF